MAKFKILLIDDIASDFIKEDATFTRNNGRDVNIPLPFLNTTNTPFERELDDSFELVCLRTPQECRACYDLFKEIDAENPKSLVEDAPDLMFVDYALSNDNPTSINGFAKPLETTIEENDLCDVAREYLLRLSPLPTLRNIAKNEIGMPSEEIISTCFTAREMRKYGVEDTRDNPHTFTEDDVYNYVNCGEPRNDHRVAPTEDHMGIQAGSIIYGIFSSRYPVSLVANTAYDEMVGRSETAFLEYMHWRELGKTFTEKGIRRRKIDLVCRGVKYYRERAANLAIRGIITIDFQTVKTLAALENGPLPETIRIESAYGMKELPINGLFIDVGYDDQGRPNGTETEREEKRVDEARKWARGILNGWIEQIRNNVYDTTDDARQDLERGMEFAETLFNIARDPNNAERVTRYNISMEVSKILGDLRQRMDDDEWRNVRIRGFDTIQRRGNITDGLCDVIRNQYGDNSYYYEKICAYRYAMPDECSLVTLTHGIQRQYQVRRWIMLIAYALMVKEIVRKFLIPQIDGIEIPSSFIRERKHANAYCKSSFQGGAMQLGKCLIYDILYPLISRPVLLPFHNNAETDFSRVYNIHGAFGNNTFEDGCSATQLLEELLNGDDSHLQAGELAILKSYYLGLN